MNIGQHRPGPSNADPFYVPPMAAPPMESSPTAAINALAHLRAQADAASTLLRPVQRRRNVLHQTASELQIDHQPSVANLHAAANSISHVARRVYPHQHNELLQSAQIQFQIHVPALEPHPSLQQQSILGAAQQPFNKNQIKIYDLGRMNLACCVCKAYHWKAGQLSKKMDSQIMACVALVEKQLLLS